MIRKNQEFLNRVNIILDMLLVIASYLFASWFWLEGLGRGGNMAAISQKTVLMAAAYAVLLFAFLSFCGFYQTTRARRFKWKVRIIFFCVTILTLIAAAILFVFRFVDFSRGVMLLFYLGTLYVLFSKYFFMRLLLRQIRAKGYNLKHVVVIGTGKLALQYKQNIMAEPELGYHIKGFIGAPTSLIDDDEYLGGIEDLHNLIVSPDISEAIIALGTGEFAHIRRIISICERNGVKYSIIPFYNDVIPANPIIESIGSTKLINMRVNRLEIIGWAFLKRFFDLIVSAVSLVLLSPLLLVIAIGVKLSSPGPVIFKQTRVGFNRRNFEMLKFRSLVVNDKENTAWTGVTDSRRTKFGAFIRKTSLDELPQLINVLKGDMSLVGPRPEIPHFVEQFKETIPYYMVKHQVKPGITGWAQVNGYRGDTSIEKRNELDIWYIENWSPWLDIKIIFKTAFGGMINAEKIN